MVRKKLNFIGFCQLFCVFEGVNLCVWLSWQPCGINNVRYFVYELTLTYCQSFMKIWDHECLALFKIFCFYMELRFYFAHWLPGACERKEWLPIWPLIEGSMSTVLTNWPYHTMDWNVNMLRCKWFISETLNVYDVQKTASFYAGMTLQTNFKVKRGNIQVCEYGYLQWVFIVDLTVVILIIISIIIIIIIFIIKHWISLKMCYK